jgi:hypothetical protein
MNNITSIIINCFASVVSPYTESNGATASSILPPRTAVSPKTVRHMMRPSAPDKHGGTVHSWAYIVSTYPTLSTGNKFFITFAIKMQDKKMGMKYKNLDTCLEKLCMKFFCKSHKTAQTGELFGQRVPSPSLFTLHWPTLLPLAVTMKTWDRVISPTPSCLIALPYDMYNNEQHLDNKCTPLQHTFRYLFCNTNDCFNR